MTHVARKLKNLHSGKQSKIKVSAQIQLERFYNEFGFEKTSEPYDEDGILHVDMEKTS